MNIFGLNITKTKAAQAVPSSRGWWSVVREAFAGAWQADTKISTEDLMASPTVYSCCTLVANDIGKLRARLVALDAQGIWVPSKKQPAILHCANSYQNHIQLKQWWVMSKLRFGNAYVLKQRGPGGEVVALHVLNPERVTPLVADDGSVYYKLMADPLARTGDVTVPASEIIHDRMNCLYHPLVGVAPLHAAAIAAGIGHKIQKNTLTFFSNSAKPSGILVAPGAISDETAKALKESWKSGEAGDIKVLGDGLKFEPMSSTAVDSQLIETLRWSDERVCSVFHVPGYKVGVGAEPTHANIEARDRSYYSDCLQSLIEEFEACLDDGLGYKGISEGIELDLSGLIRMDSKAQMETLGAGVDKGVLTINDARRAINHPPLTGGDTVYMQQQDFPLDQVRGNKLPDTQPAQPAQPTEETQAGALAETGSIQQEALNGAQVTALQGIVLAVGSGELQVTTAAALVRVAFPLVTEEQITAMLGQAMKDPANA